MRAGDSGGAAEEYQRALDCNANNPDALASLGGLMLNRSMHIRDAVEMLEKAVSIAPSNDWAHTRLAEGLLRLGRVEEAIRHGEKSVKISPSSDNCQALGKIYQWIGDKETACKWFENAIRKDPRNGWLYYWRTKNKCRSEKDDVVLRKMKSALNEGLSTESRIAFLFALAEMYHRMGRWDDAFEYFEKGNTLSWVGAVPDAGRRVCSQSRKIFTRSFLSQKKIPAVDKGSIPIFVVGMPRSGSTLIDQVLSSHSQIESIGETTYLEDILKRLEQEKGERYPKLLKKLNRDELVAIGDEYMSMMLGSAVGQPKFIIDKQLLNYLTLGLVSIIFPNAKIIHARRNPIDTCLSCYFQIFYARILLAWSCDLKSAGEQYCRYQEMMEYWKNVLEIPILDVGYEDMVMDFDTTVRRMLEFCSLSWEPQLKDFYKQEGVVMTASHDQVRQPIYSGSVGRWRPYARHIVPLLQSLAPCLEENDRAVLSECGLDIRKPNLFSRLLG